MRAYWLAVILATLCCSVAVRAQGVGRLSVADIRPLEGTWVLDLARSGLPETDAERRIMTLGPAWLRVDLRRTRDAHPVALIYNLDGSTNVNAFGDGTAVTKLTRDGDEIVLETVFTVSDQAVTLSERVPLVPGLNLPIAAMLRVEHGYQGVPPAGVRTPPNVSNVTKFYNKER